MTNNRKNKESESRNLFLSWSGEASNAMAMALRDWIPQVINDAKPWVSSADIDKGSRWSTEIDRKLSRIGFGVTCLTNDNLTAPWLMFEAGAVSKHVGESYVCPYLLELDLPLSEITGPLARFQAAHANRKDTKLLIEAINKALGAPRASKQLDDAFETWWPKLEMQLSEIRAMPKRAVTARPKRTTEDILDAIWLDVRRLSQSAAPGTDNGAKRPGVLFHNPTASPDLLVKANFQSIDTIILSLLKTGVPATSWVSRPEEDGFTHAIDFAAGVESSAVSNACSALGRIPGIFQILLAA